MMDRALSFDDILLVPNLTSAESRLSVKIESRIGNLKIRTPILSAPMDCVTDSFFAKEINSFGGVGILHRFMNDEELEDHIENLTFSKDLDPEFKIFISIGISDADFKRLLYIMEDYNYGNYIDLVLIDVANGFSTHVGNFVRKVKERFPSLHVMAGNVACDKGFKYLADCGADSVRVGIGGGSVCKTRVMTGFGLPTLTSVKMCHDFKVKNYKNYGKISIIADGGIRNPSDLVKSIAFGADAVIMGSVFARSRESCAKKVFVDGIECVSYRGMASKEFQEEYRGGLKEGTCSEGVSLNIPISGSLSDIMQEFLGGLRSALTYSGFNDISSFKGNINYMVVSSAGIAESYPHASLIS